MNRLQYETSPYLLQHKDNPVDWYPWGEEAIKKAHEEDKPILLSIGYSACHWCHVMAHESFENPDIAALMNSLFINIKVDREERPDIDNIYMNFVQLTTGSGGWPLTVVLTPDLVPFFGGTYFPPNDKYGRPGFPKIIRSVAEAYRTKRQEINAQKTEVISALASSGAAEGEKREFSENDFNLAWQSILKSYDEIWGGFGRAPKFPSSMTLMFLMRLYSVTNNETALEVVENSLYKMAQGGMYDQLGGGFHRYSTDDQWLVPHFEKMLYDNALLSRTYMEAYQLTGNRFFLSIALDVLGFIMREMTDTSGGFYSAQDADTEGEEGKFFLWHASELKKMLSDDEYDICCRYYSVHETGNFEGRNILTRRVPVKDISIDTGKDESGLVSALEELREKLFQNREKRVKPGLDDKILSGWNALMLYSFALAYGITGEEKYLSAAQDNAEFIWDKFFKDNILYHSYKQGIAKIEGFLDDYALTAEAFIQLYSVTFNEKWIERADRLLSLMNERFYDPSQGGYFYTSGSAENLIVRARDPYDNVIPSGSSSAVNALVKMSLFASKPDYYDIAETVVSYMHDPVIKYPLGFSYMLSASLVMHKGIREIAVIAEEENDLQAISRQFYNSYFPFAILSAGIDKKESTLELLKGKNAIKGKPTIYVCRNFTCDSPVFSFDEMKEKLNS